MSSLFSSEEIAVLATMLVIINPSNTSDAKSIIIIVTVESQPFRQKPRNPYLIILKSIVIIYANIYFPFSSSLIIRPLSKLITRLFKLLIISLLWVARIIIVPNSLILSNNFMISAELI